MQFEPLLNGRHIQLERLTTGHIPELQLIALDASIWANLPYKIYDNTSFIRFIEEVKEKNTTDECVTYVVRNKVNNTVCGSTGYINIDPVNRLLEIGPTWLSPKVWGTKVNIESKYLLLAQCFERLNIMRVEFRTRETNIRSQKSIEKTGGTKEGILRCHRINDDGTFRNAIVYSILQPEWIYKKEKLQTIIQQ